MSAGGWRRMLGWLVMPVALGYLGWLLHGQWSELHRALKLIEPIWLALALIPAAGMYLIKAYYHVRILRQLEPPLPAWADIMRAYCEAQVLRYLPGKVWGVVFQGARLKQVVSLPGVIAGNLIQTVYTTGGTVGLCGVAALALLLDEPIYWILLLPGVLLLALLHRMALPERLGLVLLQRIVRQTPLPLKSPPLRETAMVIALLAADWLMFWAAWMLFAADLMPPATAVQLSLCYSVAALTANLAVLMPGGLVIREALFVLIGQRLGYGSEQLLLLGLLARVLFMAAELLVIPIMAVAQKNLANHLHAH